MVRMIADGMQKRGHRVTVWSAARVFQRLPMGRRLAKWLGYVDQFVLFSVWIRWRLMFEPPDTIFVFTDQALGPWVPLVQHRPHVVHLNDFLAIRSALGEFPQNPTSWSGRVYQSLIRRGLAKGKYFIAISEKTRSDLMRLVCSDPNKSQTVHLGLNYAYHPMSREQALRVLPLEARGAHPENGFLLHVGGNQWYKNRRGVLMMYQAYAERTSIPLPLWMVGAPPTPELRKQAKLSTLRGGQVYFFSGWGDEALCGGYSLAALFLFPSLAEGFGWPIAEAMACGCPVITTGEAPMTEVGGGAALYIPPLKEEGADQWSNEGAIRVAQLLARVRVEPQIRQQCLEQAGLFNVCTALSTYEASYQRVIAMQDESN